ncbi:Hypothetical predicted protein [Podarcis lilfordi]|uniref:FAM194 C-terminal domain-containing protein n=1 Tax=Podarcis lilfordi TaxID=74358 RepID=A0AA35KWU3_9SAUR|nr:Hypothetical predicted protein [Podarcis lilfordi]
MAACLSVQKEAPLSSANLLSVGRLLRHKILLREMAETLEQEPIYFFDQLKTTGKQKRNMKIEPGEHFVDINLISTDPDPHEIHRNSGCMDEHRERNYSFVKDSIAKKEPVSTKTDGPSISINISENPLARLSQIPSFPPAEEDLRSTSLEEHKCMAATILCELEEMLKRFTKFKFILPQGVLNILSSSWKDLIEGVWQNKKYLQELAYKNLKSRRRQASQESNRLPPTCEYTDYETAKNVKRKSRKSVDFPMGATKGMDNPGALSNRLNGSKTAVPQQYSSDSPFAISFSLSSKLCKERGWVLQHSDCDSKDLEWKAPYVWAVERLRMAKIEITEQLSKLKESGFDKPIILRHYGDIKKETFPQNIKGRPICQSYSDLPCGGLYTNIFNDCPDRALVGTFTPSGHGSICFSNSSSIAMIFNQEGGMVTNKDGEILRQWKWPGEGKLDDPVIMQVNKCITVKVAGRFAVGLLYKWRHESVRLSLSPVRGVAGPQLENLSKIFTKVNLPPTSVKGFSKTHGKTEDAKKSLKKEERIPRIPEEDLSHVKDYNPTRELKVLRCKIKNILEDWMEYYRIALEISSPHTRRTSAFPRIAGRRCKTQHGDAFLGFHTAQGKENDRETETLTPGNHPPFQSVLSCGPPQGVSPGFYRDPHLLSSIFRTNKPPMTHLNVNNDTLQTSHKANEKACTASHSACPVVLRRTMLGDEVRICRCSNHQIPYVTDLEYDHIINNQMSSSEQITVICVTTSLRAADYDPRTDKHLEQLYERKNKNRSMPCTQGRLDSFRLLKYDIGSADEFTGHCGSLLVKRHNIAPGMFLMYIRGKLLFANYIFNGYSKSVKDLQKQIALTRNNYNRGYYLPPDYRLSSLENSLQSYPEHTQARSSHNISSCICYATDRRASIHDFVLFSLYKGATSTQEQLNK